MYKDLIFQFLNSLNEPLLKQNWIKEDSILTAGEIIQGALSMSLVAETQREKERQRQREERNIEIDRESEKERETRKG